jgi:hypothetical protein
MTVPLINLLPNPAAFSAGTGDLCPDSMVTAPDCQCRGLKRALTAARTVTFTGLPAFPRPTVRFVRTIPAVRNPFKPHK